MYSVFIKIEEPENTKPEKDRPDIFIPDDGKTSVDVYFYKKSREKTIGALYKILSHGMNHLQKKGDIKFHDDGEGYKQTTASTKGTSWLTGDEPPVIHDIKTALQGIDMIVDEGEGSPHMIHYIRKKDDSEDQLSHYVRFVQLLTGYKVMKMTGKEDEKRPDFIKYTIECKNDNGVLATPYHYDNEKDLLSGDWWKTAAPEGGELDVAYSKMLKALTTSLRAGGPIDEAALKDMRNLLEPYRDEIGKLHKFPTFTFSSHFGSGNKDSQTAESDEKGDEK